MNDTTHVATGSSSAGQKAEPPQRMTLRETKAALSTHIADSRLSIETTKTMADPGFNKHDAAGWETIYRLELAELAMLEEVLRWLNQVEDPNE